MKRKPRTKVTPEIVKRMEELRKKGLSYVKIAGELNVSPMTVYSHLKKKVGFFEKLKERLFKRKGGSSTI